VVILGTSHYGAGPELFSATRKNYATPFGAVATDSAFIDRIAARYAGDLFLAYALGVRGYQIVPILVSSFHEMVASGVTPARDPRVGSFIEAMKAELD